MLLLHLLLQGAVLPPASSAAAGGGAPCRSAADCAHNGACGAAGACACAPAWSGAADCSALAFVPGAVDSGYRQVSAAANTSSWGGTALHDAGSGLWWFFGSELAGHCGMHAWTTNSRIVRAVGASPVGRFLPEAGANASAEVVIPLWSHEVAPARGPRGEFVLFASAEVPCTRPLCAGCRDGSTPPKTCGAARDAGAGAGAVGVGAVGVGIEDTDPSYMTWAPAPTGPWSAPVLVGPKKVTMDANLAAVINADGSLVGMWRDHTGPHGSTPHPITASNWSDPRTYAWSEEVLFKDAAGPLEDMFLYKDAAGIFHALFHLQYGCGTDHSCGGHAYSVDGKAWTFTGSAYTSHTRYDDGSSADFPFCERPHFVFAADGTTPLALTNGVKPGWGAGGDQSFTLLRPLAAAHGDARAYSTVAAAAAAAAPAAPAAAAPLNPLAYPIFAADTGTLARFKVAGGSAAWTPRHPDTLVAYLPPQPLSKVGDAVAVALSWRSNGTDECARSTWGGGGCVANKCASTSAYKSVHCVGGTGDFRVGLFDSAGAGKASASGFCPFTSYSDMEKCLGEKPWGDYKGYHLRLFPHAGADAKGYPTAVPCGWYKRGSTVPGKDFLFDDTRIDEFGCFDLPGGGSPATLTLTYARTGAGEVTLTAELNGVKRTAKDADASAQLAAIDTWAIQFPNDRPYSFVQWGAAAGEAGARAHSAPAGDELL